MSAIRKDDNSSAEQQNPAEKAAQHLANLLGRSVAGFIPSSDTDGDALPTVDLEIELFRDRNVGLASLVILAGLLKGNEAQRQTILDQVPLEYFWEKSFDRFLFERMVARLRQQAEISHSEVEASVIEYGPAVYGEASNERSLAGHHFTARQVLNLAPTARQIDQAIKVRRMWARKRGSLA